MTYPLKQFGVVLSSDTRQKIILALCEESLSHKKLVERFGTEIAHDIRILAVNGLVRVKIPDDKIVIYTLTDNGLQISNQLQNRKI